jgi:hypothetical protein
MPLAIIPLTNTLDTQAVAKMFLNIRFPPKNCDQSLAIPSIIAPTRYQIEGLPDFTPHSSMLAFI